LQLCATHHLRRHQAILNGRATQVGWEATERGVSATHAIGDLVDVGLFATQILLLLELVGDGECANTQNGYHCDAEQHFDQ
jgi:hypothetical protein